MQNNGGNNAADYKDDKEERTLDPYSDNASRNSPESLPFQFVML